MQFLLTKIFEFFIYFFVCLPSKFKIKFFNKLFNILNDKDADYYFTYNYRNKFIKGINNRIKKNISIIIQGPIIRKNNFTINTINLYLKNCSSQIILSTWEGELTKKEVNFLKKKKVKIIINKTPQIPGPMNINFQIMSTFGALNESKKIENNFSIKTRTDCRIYLEQFDFQIYNFFYFFKKINKKLKIGSTSFTIDKRLYGISDFIMFGETSDLLNYFDNSNILNKINNFKFFLKSFNNKKLFGNVDLKIYPENFLCYNYLKKNVDPNLKYNSNDFKKTLKNSFVIMDNSCLDIFWYKYEHHYENRDKNFGNIVGNKDVSLTFFRWLNTK